MIDPNLLGSLDADCITSRGQDLGDLDVSEDNIVHAQRAETNTVESFDWFKVSLQDFGGERKVY